MSDSDLMKKLLDGTIDPSELENNPHLYTLAERIYGREALEEMGVSGPSVDSYAYVESNNMSFADVEMPEFIPDLANISKEDSATNAKRRRKIPLFLGLIGLSTIITNFYLGMGAILCSLGIANMKEICLEDNTQVMWINAWNSEGLHSVSTWKQPGTIEIIDIVAIIVCSIMIIVGLFIKKN